MPFPPPPPGAPAVQITLPDELNLPARARAAGFASAAAYVADLVGRADAPAGGAGSVEPAGPMPVSIPARPEGSDRRSSAPERDPRTLSHAEFVAILNDIKHLPKSKATFVDCSRETIYATDEELAARHAAGTSGGEG